MVTVDVPTAAVLLADSVKTLADVAGFVPKLALTPLGRPEAVKLTLPLNPFKGLIVMVVQPEAPWRKVKPVGDAERVKFGDPVKGVLSDTLSKVAVARAGLLPLFTT